jgi:hypothetical protein
MKILLYKKYEIWGLLFSKRYARIISAKKGKTGIFCPVKQEAYHVQKSQVLHRGSVRLAGSVSEGGRNQANSVHR